MGYAGPPQLLLYTVLGLYVAQTAQPGKSLKTELTPSLPHMDMHACSNRWWRESVQDCCRDPMLPITTPPPGAARRGVRASSVPWGDG